MSSMVTLTTTSPAEPGGVTQLSSDPPLHRRAMVSTCPVLGGDSEVDDGGAAEDTVRSARVAVPQGRGLGQPGDSAVGAAPEGHADTGDLAAASRAILATARVATRMAPPSASSRVYQMSAVSLRI